MPTSQNNAPNQNDLFAIFQAQVESITAVNDIVVKAGVNKKMIKNIDEAASVMTEATQAIFNSLVNIASKDPGQFAETPKVMKTITTALGGIFSVLNDLGTMNFGSVIVAKIRIWRLYNVTYSLMKFLWQVGKVSPIPFLKASDVIKSINNNIGGLIELTQNLGQVKMAFLTHRSIRGLYRILFGHAPGTPKKPNDIGIIDMYRKLSNPSTSKKIAKGGIAIKMIASSLMDLIKAVNILGISLPLLALAWLATKLLNPITKGLIRIFRRVGNKWGAIVKGGLSLRFMAGALMVFVAGMLLVGLAVIGGLKLIGATLLVIAGIVTFVVILGLMRGLINNGIRSVRGVAIAIALLGLTAIAMVAVGQYITVNWEAFTVMTLTIAGLVAAVITIGVFKTQIQNGLTAVVLVVLFAVAMTLVMGAIAAIAALGDPSEMLQVSGIMVLILGAIIAATTIVGLAQEVIDMGLPAMMTLSIICGILSTVMMGIAAAAAVADPLEMLEVVGIMTLMIVAIGALSMAAGGLIMGPQAVLFMAGMVAMGMLVGLCGLISSVALVTALAVNAIKTIGIQESTELAKLLNMPFAAIIRGDGNESLMDILKDLPGPLQMMKITANVALLSGAMISVGLIASILQKIASLNMPDPDAGFDPKTGKPLGYKQMKSEDFAMAATNASVILGMTAAIFGDEEREFTLGDGSTFQVQVVDMAALDKLGLSVRIKVKRLAKIVGYVSNMADTLQRIASLNMPDPEAGYNKEGKPLGYKTMTHDDFMNAALNAGSILSFFVNLWGDETVEMETNEGTFSVEPISMAALENITGRTKRKVEKLGVIVSVVGNMAETLQNMSSLIIPDVHSAADFDENGRPKVWKQMTGDDLKNAALTTGSLLSFFVNLWGDKDVTLDLGTMGQVQVKCISTATLENITGSTKRKVKKLGEIIGVVSNISEILKNLSSLIIPDVHGPEDFDENGRPKKWKQMTDTDIKKAMDQAAYLMRSCIEVLGDDELTRELDNLSKRKMKKLGPAMQAVQGLEGIMEIVKNMAGGNFPIEYKMDTDKESPTYGQQVVTKTINLVKYIRDNQGAIKETIKALIMCPIEAIASIMDDKTAMNKVKKVDEDAKPIIDSINKLKGPLVGIMDTYNDKLVGANVGEVQKAYTSILHGALDPLITFDQNMMRDVQTGALPVFERVSKAMTTLNFDVKKAETLKANIQEMSSLMKTINTVDLQKLKTAEQAMHHIAYLTKSIHGDFQGLAKVLSEELLEVLNKLTDALNGLGNTTPQPATIGNATPDKGGTSGQANKANNNQKSEKLQAMNEIKQQLSKIAANLSTLAGTVHYGAITATKKLNS